MLHSCTTVLAINSKVHSTQTSNRPPELSALNNDNLPIAVAIVLLWRLVAWLPRNTSLYFDKPLMLALGAAGGVADGAASTSADGSAVSLDSGGAMVLAICQNLVFFDVGRTLVQYFIGATHKC